MTIEAERITPQPDRHLPKKSLSFPGQIKRALNLGLLVAVFNASGGGQPIPSLFPDGRSFVPDPTLTVIPEPTPSPTFEPTPFPSLTPEPTLVPTENPDPTPTFEPTPFPSLTPEPTLVPTENPTPSPTPTKPEPQPTSKEIAVTSHFSIPALGMNNVPVKNWNECGGLLPPYEKVIWSYEWCAGKNNLVLLGHYQTWDSDTGAYVHGVFWSLNQDYHSGALKTGITASYTDKSGKHSYKLLKVEHLTVADYAKVTFSWTGLPSSVVTLVTCDGAKDQYRILAVFVPDETPSKSPSKSSSPVPTKSPSESPTPTPSKSPAPSESPTPKLTATPSTNA